MNLTFGERVALARDRAGLTQEALAGAVNAGRNAVAAWEGGSRLPEGAAMVLLPGALGVSGHWLLTGDGEMYPTDEHDAAVRLDVIGRIVSGELDAEALRRLATSGAGALRASRDVQAVVPPSDPEDGQSTPPATSRTRPG